MRLKEYQISLFIIFIVVPAVAPGGSPYFDYGSGFNLSFETIRPVFAEHQGTEISAYGLRLTCGLASISKYALYADFSIAFGTKETYDFYFNHDKSENLSIGNPYLGLMTSKRTKNFAYGFGLRLPLMSGSENEAASLVNIADVYNLDAYTADYATFKFQADYLAGFGNGFHFQGDLCPTIWLENKLESTDQEYSLNYFVRVFYRDIPADIGGGFSGIYFLTDESILGHGHLHLNFDFRFGFIIMKGLKTELLFRYPLTDMLDDQLDFTVGLSLVNTSFY